VPDANGNFKGISVPDLPWRRQPKKHTERCTGCDIEHSSEHLIPVAFEDGKDPAFGYYCDDCAEAAGL
jgi:hypothetical protein